MADSADGSAGHRARLRQRLFDGDGKTLLDHELVEYLLLRMTETTAIVCAHVFNAMRDQGCHSSC